MDKTHKHSNRVENKTHLSEDNIPWQLSFKQKYYCTVSFILYMWQDDKTISREKQKEAFIRSFSSMHSGTIFESK